MRNHRHKFYKSNFVTIVVGLALLAVAPSIFAAPDEEDLKASPAPEGGAWRIESHGVPLAVVRRTPDNANVALRPLPSETDALAAIHIIERDSIAYTTNTKALGNAIKWTTTAIGSVRSFFLRPQDFSTTTVFGDSLAKKPKLILTESAAFRPESILLPSAILDATTTSAPGTTTPLEVFRDAEARLAKLNATDSRTRSPREAALRNHHLLRRGIALLRLGRYHESYADLMHVAATKEPADPTDRLRAMVRVAWLQHADGQKLDAYISYATILHDAPTPAIALRCVKELVGLRVDLADKTTDSLTALDRFITQVLESPEVARASYTENQDELSTLYSMWAQRPYVTKDRDELARRFEKVKQLTQAHVDRPNAPTRAGVLASLQLVQADFDIQLEKFADAKERLMNLARANPLPPADDLRGMSQFGRYDSQRSRVFSMLDSLVFKTTFTTEELAFLENGRERIENSLRLGEFTRANQRGISKGNRPLPNIYNADGSSKMYVQPAPPQRPVFTATKFYQMDITPDNGPKQSLQLLVGDTKGVRFPHQLLVKSSGAVPQYGMTAENTTATIDFESANPFNLSVHVPGPHLVEFRDRMRDAQIARSIFADFHLESLYGGSGIGRISLPPSVLRLRSNVQEDNWDRSKPGNQVAQVREIVEYIHPIYGRVIREAFSKVDSVKRTQSLRVKVSLPESKRQAGYDVVARPISREDVTTDTLPQIVETDKTYAMMIPPKPPPVQMPFKIVTSPSHAEPNCLGSTYHGNHVTTALSTGRQPLEKWRDFPQLTLVETLRADDDAPPEVTTWTLVLGNINTTNSKQRVVIEPNAGNKSAERIRLEIGGDYLSNQVIESSATTPRELRIAQLLSNDSRAGGFRLTGTTRPDGLTQFTSEVSHSVFGGVQSPFLLVTERRADAIYNGPTPVSTTFEEIWHLDSDPAALLINPVEFRRVITPGVANGQCTYQARGTWTERGRKTPTAEMILTAP